MDHKSNLNDIKNIVLRIKSDKNDPFTVKLGEYVSGEVYSTRETLQRLSQDRCYHGEERRRKKPRRGRV